MMQEFTPQEMMMLAAGVFGALVGVIWFGRHWFHRQSNRLLEGKRPEPALSPLERNKHPEVDVFRWRGSFLLLSAALVLFLLVGVFNFTTTPREVTDFGYMVSLEEEIEVEPPRSKVELPPPPPPPPSTYIEVPEELIEEEEVVEFEDQSIEAETAVNTEPVVETTAEPTPPPPPPPPPPPQQDEIFKVVEEMPRFPGCEDLPGTKEEKKACADQKLYEFIYKHLKYPDIARQNGVQGMVVVKFVVEKDGSISNIEIVRDIGAGCGEEVVRVVEKMRELPEKWTPGRQRGRPVRVVFLLPVRFKLADA